MLTNDVEGERGLESARICVLRKWSLRSIIVGAEVAILMEWAMKARDSRVFVEVWVEDAIEFGDATLKAARDQ